MITKKPKRVNIKWQEVINHISSYQCPSCLVIYSGGGPSQNTTRFICRCGQELIVNGGK
jgi:hypothetical protein